MKQFSTDVQLGNNLVGTYVLKIHGMCSKCGDILTEYLIYKIMTAGTGKNLSVVEKACQRFSFSQATCNKCFFPKKILTQKRKMVLLPAEQPHVLVITKSYVRQNTVSPSD